MHFRMVGLFIFMFLLYDADSTCTSNPLILDPPEVIGEYNTSVSVNCTSTEEDHDGMNWSSDKMNETNFSYVTTTLVMDWDVKAQCIIKDGKDECSKDLDITVYKNPEAVQMFSIDNVQAAKEKTEYELQCDIINVAPVEKLIVKWYKDNEIIKTQSFNKTTKMPETESSILTHILSRGDNGAQFRCEAQLYFGPDGPQCPNVSSGVHTVSVHYAPEFKNKTDIDEVYLKEGDNVTLNCEAEGNPPPVLHWTIDGDIISQNTNNLFINHVNVSANYSCTASNSVHNITKQIHVHVAKTIVAVTFPGPSPTTAEAKDCPLTLTPAEIVVRFGDRALINCSTSDTDASRVGWNATVGDVEAEYSSSVLWDVDKLEDWDIKPKCYLTQGDSQCTRMPVITLYKTPDSVSIIDSHNNPMEEGKECQLTCHVINVAPVRNLTVKWYRGSETMYTQTFDNSSVTPMNVSSTWSFIPERVDNGKQIKCEAELHLGPELIPTTSSALYTANVHYEPVIENCSSSFTGVESQFTLESLGCRGDGNPQPSVAWLKQDGTEVDSSQLLTRTDSGNYTVEYANIKGMINAHINITVEYGPSFTCDNHRDVKENDETKTMCEADGIPQPKITWYKDGNEITPPQRWSRNHSGMYSLEATNKHGEANHTLNLNVLYKPVIKDCSRSFTGMENQLKLEMVPCHGDGNPPPRVAWLKQDGTEVDSSKPLTRTDSGNYTAEFENGIGMQRTSVYITVEYGPSFTCGDVKENDETKTTCKADGIPQPKITWYKDGNEITPPQRWSRNHSGIYSLEATNKHGEANHTLNVNVLYTPEFKEEGKNVELTENDDVTFTCIAEGNPLPNITWKFKSEKNGIETTRGSQENITIIKATSTDIGVYSCIATNKIGNVTRSFSLKMKEKSHFWIIILTAAAIILLLLTLIIIFTKKRKNRKGQYDFSPVKTKDDSNIPLDTMSN